MDGFRENNETLLRSLYLQVVEGVRQLSNNQIDGFVLSSNLTVDPGTRPNPWTIQVFPSDGDFDHNPICLKIEAPANDANAQPCSGLQQDQGELETAVGAMALSKK